MSQLNSVTYTHQNIDWAKPLISVYNSKEIKKEFIKEFVIDKLKENFSSSTLITDDYRPTETFKKMMRFLIPNIKEEHITSLNTINDVLQEVFFKPDAGKFRYEIWKAEDPHITFDNPDLNDWYQKSKDAQSLKNVDFKADTALILGSTIANFCKRFSFLLQEASNNYSIRRIAALGGNRDLPEAELKYFKDNGFTSEREIVTEYDFMEAITNNRENVRKMLKLQGLSQKSIKKCLMEYDKIREKICVNTINPNKKPITYETVADYIKLRGNVENENIVVVSSQPFNDYQLLTTLNAFLKAGKMPQNLGCIGMPCNSETLRLFGNNTAKLLYTILDILDGIEAKVK